ncbi:MAG: anti-sigma factor antagonist, partial [Firmicutes bacterium]|nr:anti-sigma factor antagonist [Bacillota bacterium]
ADKLLKKTGLKNVVFDMRRVTFMDSSGIGVIMGRYRVVSAIGGRAAVFGMSKNIERIIEMSGLRNIVIITDKLQSALEEVCDYAKK